MSEIACFRQPSRFLEQGLTLDSTGNLYGLANFGGAYNAGTAFRLDPAGTLTVLHTFAGGVNDGANPFDRLTFDSAGNLYGTASYGGTGDCAGQGAGSCGVVFKIAP